jgi:hypothetical protein
MKNAPLRIDRAPVEAALRAEIERLKMDAEHHLCAYAQMFVELERLRAEVQAWHECAQYDAAETKLLREAANIDGFHRVLAARDATIERLRIALQRIVNEADSDDGLTAWDGSDIARAALEPKP